ncbi:hypothetical protein SAMN05660991_03542 [Trujillonella endophytica]|uniref:Uncharacterized protein n=1 Tax=Trujillonella endophytica TaxID=673521 RepID=A0A1H8VHT3_9ACTN|nr:hypothetical protein SAMN05660991_03542 [Trujillella endophytica]
MARTPVRVLAGVALLTVAAPTLSAAPARAEDGAGATVQCEITDPSLPELSGLVVGADGTMLAINDGGDQVAVHVIDPACQVTGVHTADVDPYDPEDLAVGPDGTVWLADTGDNNAVRETVALLALRPDGSTGVHRLVYPDGPRDAEALLIAPDGTPYVVTKEVFGSSDVYRPVAALEADGTVGLVEVASVDLTLTGTPGGPVGRAGQLLVTGGAVAPDGHALALRTYTDAYVWPLVGSDVVAALAAEPVRVALPNSPQGEAISFSADGSALVVASEGLPSAVTVVPVPTGTAPADATGASDGSLTDVLTESDDGVSPVAAGLTAAVVATLALWVVGRWRRRGSAPGGPPRG